MRRRRGRRERRSLAAAALVSTFLVAAYVAAGLWYGGRHLWPQAVIFGGFALNQVGAWSGLVSTGWLRSHFKH